MLRHPRLVQFVRRRLTPDEKFGLYLTIGSAVTFFFIYVFFGVVIDLIGQKALSRADLRVINLLQIFRAPTFNEVMLFVTYLGQWQVVIAGLAVLSLLLLLMRRRHALFVLLMSVGLGEIFVWLAEQMLRRPRPPLQGALAPARGFSFPSGHSFIAVSFYGLLTYFLLRFVRGKLRKTVVLVAGTAIILAIGFSRIYLGVHWPSDVLASYAAGAAWLTILITSLEIRRKFNEMDRPKPMIKRPVVMALGAVLGLSWIFFAASFYWTHPLKTPAIIGGEDRIIAAADIPRRLFDDLPRTSESLTGAPIEPVNFVIVGTVEQVDRAFREADWLPTDPFVPDNIWRMILATVLNKPYPQGPGVPAFWDSRPNDLAYEQATWKRTIRERHHIHIWFTPYLSTSGQRVWFGTAHFDRGIKFKTAFVIPTHSIDPALDKEREKIRVDLTKTGLVAKEEDFQVVDPVLGKNPAGDMYFTDGKAAVIVLRDRP